MAQWEDNVRHCIASGTNVEACQMAQTGEECKGVLGGMNKGSNKDSMAA
jgi:hypothetical protein